MSIHAKTTTKAPQIRTISEPQKNDVFLTTPKTEATEVEISLPMLLLILVGIAAVIYGGIYFFTGKNPTSGDLTKKQPETLEESLADVNNVSLADVAFTGNENAKYVFLALSDLECPACQYYATGLGSTSIESQVMKRYVDTGIVRYGFIPYVVVPSHKPAVTNENIGYMCAKEQGKGLEFAATVFSTTSGNGIGIDGKGAERKAVISLAKTVGVDEAAFTTCYDARDIVKLDTISERITKEVKDVWVNQKGDFFGTPAFLICKVNQESSLSCSGKAFVGAFPFEDMQKALDTFLGADAPKQ